MRPLTSITAAVTLGTKPETSAFGGGRVAAATCRHLASVRAPSAKESVVRTQKRCARYRDNPNRSESYRSPESLRNSPLSVPTGCCGDTFACLHSALGHDRHRPDVVRGRDLGFAACPHSLPFSLPSF